MKRDKVNLFIIGINKAGTSWLYYLLNSHPDIYMSEIKEIYYFGNEYPNNMKEYLKNFDFNQDNIYFGESTPMYHRQSSIADEINEYCPEAKVFAIVRDPIDRLISQFHYHKQIGLISENASINNLAEYRESCIIPDSHYERNLPYFQKVFNENMKIISLENLIKNKNQVWNAIQDFLELKQVPLPNTEQKPKNATGGFLFRIIYKLTVSRIKEHHPTFYRKMLKSRFIKFIKSILIKILGKAKKEKLDSEVRSKLLEEYNVTYDYINKLDIGYRYENSL